MTPMLAQGRLAHLPTRNPLHDASAVNGLRQLRSGVSRREVMA